MSPIDPLPDPAVPVDPAVVIAPTPVVDQSLNSAAAQQMQLAQSPVFLSRVQYYLMKFAAQIFKEPHNTLGHAERFLYAQQVIASPAAMAERAAPLIVGADSLVGTVVIWPTGTPFDGQLDSSATDTAVAGVVNDAINTLARVDQGV